MQHQHLSNTDIQNMYNMHVGHMYEHYKGKQYRVLSIARHADDLAWVVVYECLYENSISQIWVRPLEQFIDTVIIEGNTVPRFRYIGQK